MPIILLLLILAFLAPDIRLLSSSSYEMPKGCDEPAMKAWAQSDAARDALEADELRAQADRMSKRNRNASVAEGFACVQWWEHIERQIERAPAPEERRPGAER